MSVVGAKSILMPLLLKLFLLSVFQLLLAHAPLQSRISPQTSTLVSLPYFALIHLTTSGMLYFICLSRSAFSKSRLTATIDGSAIRTLLVSLLNATMSGLTKLFLTGILGSRLIWWPSFRNLFITPLTMTLWRKVL